MREDEQHVDTNLDDQEYEVAFDEDEASPASTSTDTEGGDKSEGEDPGGTQAGDKDDRVDNQHDESEPPGDQHAEDESGEHQDVPANEQEQPLTEQQLKSWEGRLRKRQQELERQQQELGGGEFEEEDQGGADAQEQQHTDEDISFDDDQEFQQFAEDYPEVAQAMTRMMNRMVGKMVDTRMGQAVEPIRQDIDRRDLETHFSEIRRAHPDFDNLVEDVESNPLLEWIEGLPYRDANRYMEIYNKGRAQDVIGMVADFKKAREGDQASGGNPQDTDPKANDQQQQQQERDPVRQQRKSGGRAIPNHSSRPDPSRRGPDLDDFDGAWDDD